MGGNTGGGSGRPGLMKELWVGMEVGAGVTGAFVGAGTGGSVGATTRVEQKPKLLPQGGRMQSLAHSELVMQSESLRQVQEPFRVEVGAGTEVGARMGAGAGGGGGIVVPPTHALVPLTHENWQLVPGHAAVSRQSLSDQQKHDCASTDDGSRVVVARSQTAIT